MLAGWMMNTNQFLGQWSQSPRSAESAGQPRGHTTQGGGVVTWGVAPQWWLGAWCAGPNGGVLSGHSGCPLGHRNGHHEPTDTSRCMHGVGVAMPGCGGGSQLGLNPQTTAPSPTARWWNNFHKPPQWSKTIKPERPRAHMVSSSQFPNGSGGFKPDMALDGVDGS